MAYVWVLKVQTYEKCLAKCTNQGDSLNELVKKECSSIVKIVK